MESLVEREGSYEGVPCRADVQATIHVHGGGPLPDVNGFHYFAVAVVWGQRLYPGGVPVHTVVHPPCMYRHPILVIESLCCILVFSYSLQCPARLSHVYRLTVSAGDLIYHSFLQLVRCLALHLDQILPQSASRLKDCLDIEWAADLLNPLTHVEKKQHLPLLLVLGSTLWWITSGSVQHLGNNQSGEAVGLEDVLEVSSLLILGG